MFEKELASSKSAVERSARRLLGPRLLAALVFIVAVSGTGIWAAAPNVYSFIITFRDRRLTAHQEEMQRTLSNTVQASFTQGTDLFNLIGFQYFVSQEYHFDSKNLCAAQVKIIERFTMHDKTLRNLQFTDKFDFGDVKEIGFHKDLKWSDVPLINDIKLDTLTEGTYHINLLMKFNTVAMEWYGQDTNSTIPPDNPHFFGASGITLYVKGKQAAIDAEKSITALAKRCGSTDVELEPN